MRGGRVARGLTRGLVVLVLLSATAALALLAYANSERGTRALLQRAVAELEKQGITLQWQTVTGGVLTGLQLSGVRLSLPGDNGVSVLTANALTLEVNPLLLLAKTVQLDELSASGVVYTAAPAATPAKPFAAEDLQAMLFTLPVRLVLSSAMLRDVELRFGDSVTAFDALDITAVLDNAALAIDALQWRQGGTIVNGELRLARSLAVEGAVAWRSLIKAATYAGTVDIGGSLQQLSVQHRLLQPAVIDSSGLISPALFDDTPESVQLTHRFTQLPLAAFAAGDYVISGEVTTTGTATALALAGNVNTTITGFEPLRLDFAVDYQPERLDVGSVRVSSTQIDVQASGAVDLQSEALQLQWQLSRLSPGAALPAFQLLGVSGNGDVAVQRSNGVIDTAVTLAQLKGVLNGTPLTIDGNLHLADATVNTVALNVIDGANRITATGALNPALDLQWQVQVPDLSALWQPFGGAVRGQGELKGSRESPQINGNLTANNLAWQQEGSTLRLATLQMAAKSDARANDFTLSATGLTRSSAGGKTRNLLDTANLHATGTLQQHAIDGEFRSDGVDVDLALQGNRQGEDWSGLLQRALVDSRYGSWQLEQPVALSYASAILQIDEGCWGYQAVRVCANAGYAADGVDAHMRASGIPLQWLNNMTDSGAVQQKPEGVRQWQDSVALHLPDKVHAEGNVSLEAAIDNYADGDWAALNVDLTTENARTEITIPADPQDLGASDVQQTVRFDNANAHLQNSGGIWDGRASFQLIVEEGDDSEQQGRFATALQMDADGKLKGNANFAFAQLAWLELLQPQVRNLQGTVTGDVDIGGSRDAPELLARIDLRNGAFTIPAAGLQLTDTNVALASSGTNDFTIKGSAHSGDGNLTIDAALQNVLVDEFGFTATVNGDNFQLLNTVDTSATISPELRLDYRNNSMQVAGKVTVPHMALNLADAVKDARAGTVKVSRDTVIVKDEEGNDVQPANSVVNVPVLATIALSLGDDVRVRGYGLDARIAGMLDIEQGADKPALVYGQLSIPQGTYELYRQQLQIQGGRLLFFGSPLNPQVDIRAVRYTTDGQAGMHLTGLASNIKGELFSSPTLPESEILALLVTGKSFSTLTDQEGSLLLSAITDYGFEKGQGLTSFVSSTLGLDTVQVERGKTLEDSALGVGKYLMPGMMLRYKIGIFDRQSVLGIDYKLTDRLKLVVETGLSQSIDISYTKEMD